VNWAYFINFIHEWHEHLHTLLSTHANSIKQNPTKHGLALIALSLIYGIFHAVGPGHGKAIIVLYLSSHKESLKRGATIALLAALLQSIVAIVLVVFLSLFLNLTFSTAEKYAGNIAVISYLLVAALGANLFITALLTDLKRPKRTVIKRDKDKQSQQHQHQEHSCCGGKHAHQANPEESWLQSLGVIVSMGIRPCSGAIIVLVYAHLVGFFHYGVIATLTMGLGTGLSVACIALLTQYARNQLQKFAQADSHHSLHYLALGYRLRMIGGLFICLVGLSLFEYASA